MIEIMDMTLDLREQYSTRNCLLIASHFHMKITVLQKARIKVVARAIYTYLFFS